MHSHKGLALLSAIAAGDAAVEDIAAELRRDGIDSLDAALAVLRDGIKAHEGEQANLARPINIQRFQNSTPMDPSRIVQRVPEVPFLLNGTLYDPEDITRFNGHELHFVAEPTSDHMLVIDDRQVMANWWQQLYLESYRSTASQQGKSSSRHPGGRIGPGARVLGATPRDYNVTYFCEDIDSGGAFFILWGDRGYYDLTKVCMGAFCTGDWNDEISSLGFDATHVAVLWEHIHWTGQSFTVSTSSPPAGVPNLHIYGWGDRASSVETW